ncbi:MAG TPA: hypothetical protein PLW72_10010 [Burkholderiaceae bacterium]|nr:hypothetical protein [Burkholderiaceae bacterium]HQR77552.1 hypothetical protein [Burkholderiaceae bacterium]
MPPIRILNFQFGPKRLTMALLQRTQTVRWVERTTMERTLQRTDERNQLSRFFEWLTEAFERAQMRDHDRYVSGASNPREVSQRLHRIEIGEESFHA